MQKKKKRRRVVSVKKEEDKLKIYEGTKNGVSRFRNSITWSAFQR